MSDYNRVVVCGRLGRDAEVRFTAGGQAVATLNLATTEVWYNKERQRQERTEWHRIVLWGKQAETLQEYLVKGKQLLVEGKLQTREWADKDGNKRYTTEIKADQVVLLGGGERRDSAQASRGVSDPVAEETTEPEEQEIPF